MFWLMYRMLQFMCSHYTPFLNAFLHITDVLPKKLSIDEFETRVKFTPMSGLRLINQEGKVVSA